MHSGNITTQHNMEWEESNFDPNLTKLSHRSDILRSMPKQKASKPHFHRNPESRPFVSCDTETYADPWTGKQFPMLFGFSTGEYITGENLKSHEMLALCKHVAETYPGAIFFGFGFDYDATFLVRDILSDKQKIRLWKGKPVRYRDIRIQFMRGKQYRFTFGRPKTSGHVSFVVYDVMGWFGKVAAITAVTKHLGTDFPEYKRMVEGKGHRESFSYDDLEYVKAYWIDEQVCYVRLMEHMRNLILEANLPLPRHWYGPSALVSRVYETRGIKEHMNTNLPEAFVDASQYAYFGGRFEQFVSGAHFGPIWQSDINSAYPEAMAKLWSWQDSHLTHITDPDRSKPFPPEYEFSLWYVEFSYTPRSIRDFQRPMPLPYRTSKGSVLFPHKVSGWYWAPEVALIWRMPNAKITEGYIIRAGKLRPFEWILEMYTERQRLKREGNPAEYALKITMNSGYGKVAQRAGAKEEKGVWRIPPYHQLDWAGYITSHCRAKIFRAINAVGWQNVISVETDGIFTLKPIPKLTLGKGLGEWDETQWHGMISIQNGVYWLRDSEMQWNKGKVRGIGVSRGAKKITAEDALDYLSRFAIDGRMATPLVGATFRFYGAVSVVKSKDKAYRFVPETKELKLGGDGKRILHPKTTGDPSQSFLPLWNGALIDTRWKNEPWTSFPHFIPWRSLGNILEARMHFDEEIEESAITLYWEG